MSRRILASMFVAGTILSQAAAQEASEKPILVVDAGGHTNLVPGLCFTPDGRELISASFDKTIRIWDVQSGEMLRVLRPPIGPNRYGAIYAAALSPDGRTLAVGGIGVGSGNPIYLIALPSGQIEKLLLGHRRGVMALAFAGDGRRLASGGHDSLARLWNVETGECEQVLSGHTAGIRSVTFSPDGSRLATSSWDRTARIWSVSDGQSMATLDGHQAELDWIAWSPDGRTIATASEDESIRLWNQDGVFQREFAGLGNYVSTVAFTGDSSGLLYTLGGNPRRTGPAVCAAAILDLASGQIRTRFEQHGASVARGVFAPGDGLVATSGGVTHEIYLWRTSDGSVVHRLGGKGKMIWGCGWSSDGQSIAWSNTANRGSENDARPLERSFRLSDLQFGGVPDASFLGASIVRGPLSLEKRDDYHVDVKRAGNVIATMAFPAETGNRVRTYTFLSDSRAVMSSPFLLSLFDTRDGGRIRDFLGQINEVPALAPSPDGTYFLAGSVDQMLRIYAAARRQSLLSLFFLEYDWIAWTPEGYYAASPGGERLMGWQMNNGLEKMGSFYPATQFRKSLYRPDLIKLLLHGGSTARAMEMADQRRGRITQAVSVEEVLPPVVLITAPSQAGFRTSQPMLEVKAHATPAGKDPITVMRLLVDGRPYEAQKRSRSESGEAVPVSDSWSVQLTPGTHQLMVKAETARSYGLSDPREVTYAPEQTVLEPPCLYVLAVGISAYEDKSLTLRYGAIDAQGLAETLQKTGRTLFRKVEQKVLLDAQAGQKGILRGLEWLKTQMTQRDVGVFFYAGHGAKDLNNVFYLIPADCDANDISVGGISEDQIKRYCQSIPGKLMLFLDACHTGALGGDNRRGAGGLTDDLLRDLVTDDYGVIVMCSSMGREVSQEDESWGHGAFTTALIDGLQGAADYDHDGTIYLNELDLYVTERVKVLTNGGQHPVTQKPTTIRSFPLVKP